MGNKGQSTSQTTQAQSYTPNPQAAGYIQNALGQAQSAAATPFQAPVAPVANFSQDQRTAFNTVNNAQGMAQPYYNQAASYFSPQGTQDFLNPYAANVMGNLSDVFGQQNQQNDANLTQAAGGVGADRIAVGHAALAKQQGLVAGQTMSDLYRNSGQMAQSAGYGIANLGGASQNAAISGAQAQLGTGGLQQQLDQAQQNAPYQWDLSRLAYPFQTAQFNAGVTGALAPGLGGTTTGQGNTTNNPAQPSIFSQLLGAGTAAAGIYGGFGGFNGGSNLDSGSWGQSNPGVNGSAYYGPMAPGQARGGRVDPYAEGGMVSDEPIDISKQSMIPTGQIQPIQPHIPQLNLNPPPQQSGSSGGGDALKMGMDVAKMAMMFAKRGGRVDPYFADGGGTSMEDRFDPVKEAIANGDFDPSGANSTTFEGRPAISDANRGVVPTPRSRPQAMAFAGDPDDAASTTFPYAPPGRAPTADASAAPDATPAPQEVRQPSQVPSSPRRDPGFAGSPWAALTAAGLGMMAGTSPYAGVNIGQGGMQGIKTMEEQRAAAQKDETTNQAAQRLALEAKHHEDQYTRMTPYQKATLEKESWSQAGSIRTKAGDLHPLMIESTTGKMIDGITKEPPTESDTVIQKGGSRNTPEEISSVVDGIVDGTQPPSLTGLYGDSVHVRAGLKKAGFDLGRAQLEWKQAQVLTQSVNSGRMVQYVGLNKSVDRTIDEVKQLSDQMKQGNIPLLNKVQLMKYIQTEGNSEKGQLATQYMTAVNTLREEFANLANGGYAPTESAWKLANEQVNGDFGVKQMHASLDEIQRLIRYRLQAVPGLATMGPGASNRYTGQGGGGTPGAPAGKPSEIVQNGFTYHLQPDGETYR